MPQAKKGASKKAASKKTVSKKGAAKKSSVASKKAAPKKGAGGIGEELDRDAGSRTNLEGNASSKGKQMYGGNQATPLEDRE